MGAGGGVGQFEQVEEFVSPRGLVFGQRVRRPTWSCHRRGRLARLDDRDGGSREEEGGRGRLDARA